MLSANAPSFSIACMMDFSWCEYIQLARTLSCVTKAIMEQKMFEPLMKFLVPSRGSMSQYVFFAYSLENSFSLASLLAMASSPSTLEPSTSEDKEWVRNFSASRSASVTQESCPFLYISLGARFLKRGNRMRSTVSCSSAWTLCD